MFTVAKLLGHSTTRMVELVYRHLTDDTYRNAVAKMPPLPNLGEATMAADTAPTRRAVVAHA